MPSKPPKGGIPSSFLLGLTIGALVLFVGLQFYNPHEKRIGELETQYKTAIRASEKALQDRAKAAQERDLAFQARDAAVAGEKAALQAKEATVTDYGRCVSNKDAAIRERVEAVHDRDAAVLASADATSAKETLALALAEKEAEVHRKDAIISERDEALGVMQANESGVAERQQASDRRIQELEAQITQLQIPADQQALVDKAQEAAREKDAALEEKGEISRKLTETTAAESDARKQVEELREQLSAVKEQVKALSNAADDVDALRKKADREVENRRRFFKALWVQFIWNDFTRFEKDLLKERAKAAGFAWHRHPKGQYFATAENSSASKAFDGSLSDILGEHGYDSTWFREPFQSTSLDADQVDTNAKALWRSVKTNLEVFITRKVFDDRPKNRRGGRR